VASDLASLVCVLQQETRHFMIHQRYLLHYGAMMFILLSSTLYLLRLHYISVTR